MKVSDHGPERLRGWSATDDEERTDPPLGVAVRDDHDVNRVTRERRAIRDAPQSRPDVQVRRPRPVARAARGAGRAAVRRGAGAASGAGGGPAPFVNDFRTDPAPPRTPPHASRDQTKAAAPSGSKGDRDRGSVMRQGVKAEVQEFQPGDGRT